MALTVAVFLFAGCSSSTGPGVVAPPDFGQAPQASPSQESSPSVEPQVPQPESEPAVELATLSVSSHCYCTGPRGQAQVKVKVSITNGSTAPISIDLSRFRLVVEHPFAVDWTPVAPAGGLSTVEGRTFIPPNGDGNDKAETFDGLTTFVTHWSATELPAGATYHDTAVKQGDLVFYMPLAADGGFSLIGLAMLDDAGGVIAFTPRESFGPYADPNTF